MKLHKIVDSGGGLNIKIPQEVVLKYNITKQDCVNWNVVNGKIELKILKRMV